MLYVLIFLTLIRKSYLDCGCDQLKREGEFTDNGRESFTDDSNQCFISRQPGKRSNDMALIPGGTYTIGTNNAIIPADREGPEKEVTIKSFYIDKYEVSNNKFKIFVKSEGYITEAEKFNDSFIFQSLLTDNVKEKYVDFRVVGAPWWYKVNGINWRNPHGQRQNLEGYWDHPVVHISWNDALAYCKWSGKRLPTEVEWESACRGGKKNRMFPWGNKMLPKGKHRMNIWQGTFPEENTKDDGYEITCPVDQFQQNDYDMYNIVGNVWEWTADLWDPNEKSASPNRVKKGGSYLCHESYCYRYRCAARSQNTQDSSSGNLGFRCAMDV